MTGPHSDLSAACSAVSAVLREAEAMSPSRRSAYLANTAEQALLALAGCFPGRARAKVAPLRLLCANMVLVDAAHADVWDAHRHALRRATAGLLYLLWLRLTQAASPSAHSVALSCIPAIRPPHETMTQPPSAT